MPATPLDPASPPVSPTISVPEQAPAALRAGAALLLLLLALCGIALLLSASMARDVTFDEDPFLAGGLMVANGLLPYRDFAFLQAPLQAFALAAVFKLSGGWYVLSGRLLTFTLSVVSAALLWRLLRRLGADRVLGGVLLAACLASPFLATPLASARNDMLALTLFLAGLLLHLWAGDRSWTGRFAAALLMGLAVEAKLSFLFGPVALLAHAAFAPRRRLLPVLAGTLLAAVPMLLLVGAAGTAAVGFALFGDHALATADWYRQQGQEAGLDAPVRLQMVLTWLFNGGNLTLLVMSVALTLITFARKRNWKRPGQLLVFMLVGAAALAFLQVPSWAMYFAVLAPLLACCIAHLHRITTHLADPVRKRVLALVAALPVLPVLLAQGPEIARFARGDWAGLRAHRTALAVAAALPPNSPVATLFPHLVMDASPVPLAFASGPMVFRAGDSYTAAQLARLHALSPGTLAAAFAQDPPAAIFAGAYAGVFHTPMDQALTDFAEKAGWRLVLTAPDGGRLWVNAGR